MRRLASRNNAPRPLQSMTIARLAVVAQSDREVRPLGETVSSSHRIHRTVFRSSSRSRSRSWSWSSLSLSGECSCSSCLGGRRASHACIPLFAYARGSSEWSRTPGGRIVLRRRLHLEDVVEALMHQTLDGARPCRPRPHLGPRLQAEHQPVIYPIDDLLRCCA